MELFEELGIAEQFLNAGLKIFNGHAYADNKRVGTLSFENCPPPFNFILSLPQNRTEKILENELKNIQPGCLVRGVKVQSFNQDSNFVEIKYLSDGTLKQIKASWLVGCDGKNSSVRKIAGIEYQDKEYPDTYIMGDFTDNTEFGSDAAVYLHRDGLIECFPLPGGIRRWVLKTDTYQEKPTRTSIQQLLNHRLKVDISLCDMTMISSFRVQHFLCSKFRHHRILLAGDSAHVVSPIGGQGMNLGWITARHLSRTLERIMDNPTEESQLLREWSDHDQKIVRQVARRAEMNMWLGRKQRFPFFRKLILKAMVNTPAQKFLSRLFTMRGLGKWPV